MDDYIQEPVETGGFILWKNSQRAEKEGGGGEGSDTSSESDMEGSPAHYKTCGLNLSELLFSSPSHLLIIIQEVQPHIST